MDGKTRIEIKTIGYYHRDREMNVKCGLLPRKLNHNKGYIDNPYRKVPFVNLNIMVPDSGAGELKMESLLEYIRQNPFSKDNQKPDFVTNKQLLKFIASSVFDSLEIRIVRIDGVIYMLKSTVETGSINFGKAFEHFLLKEEHDEMIKKDEAVTKAVFNMEISIDGLEQKTTFNVFYSGEIDAIDDNDQHVELKVMVNGVSEYFWKHRSCQFYWQCVLSNVQTMIIGSKTGKHPNDPKTREPRSLPEHSLYRINALKVQNMRRKAAKAANNPSNPYYKGQPHPRNQEWTFKKGEDRIRNFLQMVFELVRNDGDGVTLLNENPEEDWTIKHEKNGDLYDFIRKSTSSRKRKSESGHIDENRRAKTVKQDEKLCQNIQESPVDTSDESLKTNASVNEPSIAHVSESVETGEFDSSDPAIEKASSETIRQPKFEKQADIPRSSEELGQNSHGSSVEASESSEELIAPISLEPFVNQDPEPTDPSLFLFSLFLLGSSVEASGASEEIIAPIPPEPSVNRDPEPTDLPETSEPITQTIPVHVESTDFLGEDTSEVTGEIPTSPESPPQSKRAKRKARRFCGNISNRNGITYWNEPIRRVVFDYRPGYKIPGQEEVEISDDNQDPVSLAGGKHRNKRKRLAKQRAKEQADIPRSSEKLARNPQGSSVKASGPSEEHIAPTPPRPTDNRDPESRDPSLFLFSLFLRSSEFVSSDADLPETSKSTTSNIPVHVPESTNLLGKDTSDAKISTSPQPPEPALNFLEKRKAERKAKKLRRKESRAEKLRSLTGIIEQPIPMISTDKQGSSDTVAVEKIKKEPVFKVVFDYRPGYKIANHELSSLSDKGQEEKPSRPPMKTVDNQDPESTDPNEIGSSDANTPEAVEQLKTETSCVPTTSLRTPESTETVKTDSSEVKISTNVEIYPSLAGKKNKNKRRRLAKQRAKEQADIPRSSEELAQNPLSVEASAFKELIAPPSPKPFVNWYPESTEPVKIEAEPLTIQCQPKPYQFIINKPTEELTAEEEGRIYQHLVDHYNQLYNQEPPGERIRTIRIEKGHVVHRRRFPEIPEPDPYTWKPSYLSPIANLIYGPPVKFLIQNTAPPRLIPVRRCGTNSKVFYSIFDSKLNDLGLAISVSIFLLHHFVPTFLFYFICFLVLVLRIFQKINV